MRKTLCALILASGCAGPCVQDCAERTVRFEDAISRCERALETQNPLERDSFGISFSLAARELLGTPHITSRIQDIYRLDPGHFRAQRETLLDLYEDAITRDPRLARQELSLIEKESYTERQFTPEQVAETVRDAHAPRTYNPVLKWLKGTFGWLVRSPY
ncbi:hypothetical protein C4580_04710 [Candidatus Woesearchaeota archaeon]|nr:MAG: hypothetical protein C4580_04710 [Candidatus Woesearchaeota archaeon]